MQYTTLILESMDYSENALAIYRKLGPVHFFSKLSASEKKRAMQSANIIVIRLKYTLDEKWFPKMPNLKIIATPTTGLNHIDMDAAKKRGITVISLRGESSFLKDVPSTAEETFGLIFALVRNLPWAFDDVKKGNWDRDKWKGHQLIHKNLGIIGCGRLGKIVARYAKTFGMDIIAYDPNVDENTMKRYGVKKVSLNAVLKTSDIVSIHALFTKDTEGLIMKKHFRMMKPASYFINTARGEIIANGALEHALREKWIAGAAIDVMRNESSDGRHLTKNPLAEYARTHTNLIIVPHIGGATHEAMHVTEEFIAKKVVEKLGSKK